MKTINGLEFDISSPYVDGQTIGPAEAKALNQVRAENIGNNARAKIKEMQEREAPLSEIAAYVAEIDQAYVLTVARVSAGRKLDPYEREATRMARELLKAHLASTGRKLTTAPEGLTEDEWEEKVQGEIERLAATDDIVKAAKAEVDRKKKTADKLAEAVGVISV
jgi:DNA repair ATPase RecN